MKKICLVICLVSVIFIISVLNVKAHNFNVDDIPNNSYVIGKHLFTREINQNYDGTLRTQYIMLASTTIMSDNLDDMIIYYKDPRGNWYNVLNDRAVDVDESFDIEYVNTIPYLVKPETVVNIITNGDFYTEGYYNYEVQVSNWQEYCDADDVANYKLEVYEVKENVYTKLGETIIGGAIGRPVVVKVENGETKTIVTRVYTINEDETKNYSDYSEELVLDYSSLAKPITTANIITTGEYYTEDYYNYEIQISNLLDYSNGNEISNYKVQVFEIQNNNYILLGETNAGGLIGTPVIVNLQQGQTKRIVTKVYIINSKGARIYSDYSDVLVLYQPMTYTVSFDSDGGSDVDSQTIIEGNKAVEPTPPTKNEYRFDKWMLGNQEFNFNTTINRNINLKASWIKINYEVRKEKVDAYSPDYILSVYEDGELIEFDKIMVDDFELCNSDTPYVNINDLNDVTNVTIILNDGAEVTGVLLDE